MLMIVPLMIWSARTLIESQACNPEIASATSRAATNPIRSAGVTPKNALGAPPNAGARLTLTIQPVNALASIVPSIPMLTTPERSHRTPHNAPRASGVADRMMIGAIGGMTSMR